MVDIRKAVEKIDQGDAWDETDEVAKLEVKRPLDKVIPVRLSADKWEQIRRSPGTWNRADNIGLVCGSWNIPTKS
jgi:hypothetical protein